MALTEICRVGDDSRAAARVHRSVRRVEDSTVGQLPPVELALEGQGRVRCQNLVDLLPASSLTPGEYVLEVRLDGDGERAAPGQVRFTVGSPGLER